MGCFSLWFLRDLIIWIIVICGIVAIIRLLIPSLVPGVPPIVLQILNIVLWVIIACAIVYLIFDLLSCALVGFPRLHSLLLVSPVGLRA